MNSKAANRSRKLILAADDDADMRELYRVVLEDFPCDLVLASHGREALHRFVELRPDLVLLDIDMPVVSGLEVLRRLRSNRSSRNVPIIVVSGLARDLLAQMRQLGLEPDACINKPFNLERLQSIVGEMLGLGAAARLGSPGLMAERANIFSGYEMLDILRSDSVSTTWRARQKSLNRRVALKVLTEEASRNPEVSVALEQCSKGLAKLNHPNIVRMYDHGRTSYFHFAVFQFIEGIRLSNLMKLRTIAYDAVLALVQGVCAGVQCLHDQGMCLYSLSPSRIVIDKSGQPKIADFGLSPRPLEWVDLDQETIESATAIPPYIAPEQRREGAEVGQSADIYALGAIVFELLTWQRYTRDAKPSELNPSISRKLERTVLAALSDRPEARPPSARRLGEMLEGGLRDLIDPAARRRMKEIDYNPLRDLVRDLVAALEEQSDSD